MSFKTEMFLKGHGSGSNSTLQHAMLYVHDVLETARIEQMDVYMLCSCLHHDLRDEYYRQETKKSFTQSVEGVLAVGGNVSILLWEEFDRELISPSLMQLIAQFSMASARRGKLDVRVSNTREGSDEASHFIVACTRDRRSWALRIEEPHEEFDFNSLHSAKVSATMLQDTAASRRAGNSAVEAGTIGNKLLATFRDLFDSVPEGNMEEV